MAKAKPHPLDGKYAYFDSVLDLKVGAESTYTLHGKKYKGHFTFGGNYSLDFQGKHYSWPVTGGVVNKVAKGKWQLAFSLFQPPGRGPVFKGLGSFIDGWAAYGELDPKSGKIEFLMLRFVNVTYSGDTKNWTGFKWLPGFEDFGARTYIRVK